MGYRERLKRSAHAPGAQGEAFLPHHQAASLSTGDERQEGQPVPLEAFPKARRAGVLSDLPCSQQALPPTQKHFLQLWSQGSGGRIHTPRAGGLRRARATEFQEQPPAALLPHPLSFYPRHPDFPWRTSPPPLSFHAVWAGLTLFQTVCWG